MNSAASQSSSSECDGRSPSNRFNRNPLLKLDIGADGLKTGHTEASGFSIVVSAVRRGRRLILVLNGLTGVNERSREAERLLDWGFREFKNYEVFKPGEVVDAVPVWLGDDASVPLVIAEPLVITMTRKARRDMKVSIVLDGPAAAPVTKGTQLARLVISAPDTEPVERPLVAGEDVGRLGLVGRLGAAIGYLIFGQTTP